MRFLSLSLLFISILALTSLTQSCQKAEDSVDVAQDKIHQYLELQYNVIEDKTTAVAQFRFGNVIGTPLKLAGTAEISADGNTMTWNETLNRYEWSWTGEVTNTTFSYTDNDANTFVNTIEVREIGIPMALDTISKDSSYNLVWTGNPVAADEEIYVALNETGQVNGTLFDQKNVGATSITLNKSRLSGIDPGPITLWISRDYKPTISQATSAGGVIVGKYLDTKRSITLKN